MKKLLLLFLITTAMQVQGNAQACDLGQGGASIDFSNFAFTSFMDNGGACNFDYTISYTVDNPSNCAVNITAEVVTDGGQTSPITIVADGAPQTGSGTILSTPCAGNAFIQISGTLGAPCDMAAFTVDCANFAYNTGSLPIELISFNGKENKGQIDLAWATASEVDNKQFTVEHSANARDFNAVGLVAGIGTSSARQDYGFAHTSPIEGTNFYRLKQTDNNGDFSYSEIIAVEVENVVGTIETIKVFPNPTTDKINFSMAADLTGTFEIYNQTGLLLHEATSFNTESFVSLEGYQPGMYIVKFTTSQGNAVRRILKH